MRARAMIQLAYSKSKPHATEHIIEKRLATPEVAYELSWGYTDVSAPIIGQPDFWEHTPRYTVGVCFAKGSKKLLQYQKCFHGDDLNTTIVNARKYIASLKDELEGIG